MDNERYYPATPDETYAALLTAVRDLHKFKSSEAFSRSVSFATRISGWSWGANLSASVIPERDGSTIRVGGTAKVRTNITAKNAEHKHIVALLDAVGAEIQRARTTRPS